MLHENLQPHVVQEDVNEASSTDLEADVSAVQPPLANSGIIAEFLETSEISDGDDEVMDVSDSVDISKVNLYILNAAWFLAFPVTSIGILSPTAFAAVMPVMRTLISFPLEQFSDLNRHVFLSCISRIVQTRHSGTIKLVVRFPSKY